MNMLKRHSRELALQALFQNQFNPDSAFLYEEFIKRFKFKKKSNEFASEIKEEVLKRKKEIDEMIEKRLEHWKIDRLSLIDLNILRMAIYEVLFKKEKTPYKIAIDEALELGKKYSSDKSSLFINGILDKVFKENDERLKKH